MSQSQVLAFSFWTGTKGSWPPPLSGNSEKAQFEIGRIIGLNYPIVKAFGLLRSGFPNSLRPLAIARTCCNRNVSEAQTFLPPSTAFPSNVAETVLLLVMAGRLLSHDFAAFSRTLLLNRPRLSRRSLPGHCTWKKTPSPCPDKPLLWFLERTPPQSRRRSGTKTTHKKRGTSLFVTS